MSQLRPLLRLCDVTMTNREWLRMSGASSRLCPFVMEAASNQSPGRAAVGIPPPIVGFALIVLGVGLQIAIPAHMFDSWWLAFAIGLPFLCVGITLQAACVLTLKRANTTFAFSPSSQVVKDGPYARSRNPMYIGILLWNFGIPFVVNTFWLLPLVPLLLLYLNSWVIPKEEHYLGSAFSEEYRAYASEVRRWL
jgi:protein-S-isoprenylcysteine O-methyltransferase Ste14